MRAPGPRFEGLRALLALLLLLPPQTAAAAVDCATPGRDGTGVSLTGVVNSYFPATASAAAGANVDHPRGRPRRRGRDRRRATCCSSSRCRTPNINSTNTSSYGSGTAGNPSGYTALRSTGLYEYVVATNAVPTGGGTLNLLGTGAGNGLLNAYDNANANNNSHGVRRFQVVRVPQYGSATLTSGLTAAAWDGSSGGVLAVDVSGALTLGGATVSARRPRLPGWRRPAARRRHRRRQHRLRLRFGGQLRRRQGRGYRRERPAGSTTTPETRSTTRARTTRTSRQPSPEAWRAARRATRAAGARTATRSPTTRTPGAGAEPTEAPAARAVSPGAAASMPEALEAPCSPPA